MSGNKVTTLAEVRNDNTLISPVQALQAAIDDIVEGGRPVDKLLVLTVDTRAGEGYKVGFYASNLRSSEMLALTSRFQHWVNQMLDES